MRRRLAVAGLVAGAAILGGAVGALSFQALRPAKSQAADGGAQPGGPFTLVDQAGRKVTDQDLKGKPTVMFFGFTYCPEVCPTTLAALTAEMKALGPDADRLNVVFVTIDPDRDKPAQLAKYLRSFDPRIRGLTGTPAQIAKVASEYDVFYQKVPLDGGGYTMDHSTNTYLMDASGHFSGVMAYQEPQADAVAQLRSLVGG